MTSSVREPNESQFSRVLNWGFRRYVRRFVRKNFNAVRIAGRHHVDNVPAGPVICFLNHPGWWDPMTGVLMTDLLFADRKFNAPVDADALVQYPILNRLGFFPLDRDSKSSLKTFLREAKIRLAYDASTLWITPAGRFSDVRESASFQQGLGHLLHGGFSGTAIPMAVEYTFWNERYPEMLIEFGEPILENVLPNEKSEVTEFLEKRLFETQHSLAEKAIARNPAAFETLSVGNAGIGGVYGWFQRTTAIFTGRKHRQRHDTPDLDYSNPKSQQPGEAA